MVISLNTTVPVGVPAPLPETVAVNVTGVLTGTGFCDETAVVVLGVVPVACAVPNDSNAIAQAARAAAPIDRRG